MVSGPSMTIAAMNRLMERKELRATELLSTVLDRVNRLNGRLNALCQMNEAEARAQAEATDKRIARGERLGPLDGMPLHVKDNLFQKGAPCTWGSLLYRDFSPSEDDWAIARLRAQGAVLFAKTNTPELALAGTTDNRVFGTTRNPYDSDRIPGGSSGGAVAATAAGLGLGGLATDAGGSIRRPSGYSGVVGLRTSLGAVPRRHGFPATVNDFQTIGPVAKTVEDVSLIFDAIRASGRRGRPDDLRKTVRIWLIIDGPGFVIDDAVATAVRGVAETLQKLGYTVEEIEAPWPREAVEKAFAVMSASGAARIAGQHDPARWAELVTPQIRDLAESGRKLSSVDYVQALDTVASLRAQALDWFDEGDLWLMPTSPCTAWNIGEAYPAEIAGHPVGPRGAAIYGPVVNATGAAGLAVPIGLDGAGLPIGAQIVAAPGMDDLVLAVGETLMAEIGYLPPPELGDRPG